MSHRLPAAATANHADHDRDNSPKLFAESLELLPNQASSLMSFATDWPTGLAAHNIPEKFFAWPPNALIFGVAT